MSSENYTHQKTQTHKSYEQTRSAYWQKNKPSGACSQFVAVKMNKCVWSIF